MSNLRVIHNTKDEPVEITSLDDYSRVHATWLSFTCEKCGRRVVKRDASVRSMISSGSPLFCGPCLRKKSSLEAHGSETWNNPRYGDDNPSKRADVREKISQANRASSRAAASKRAETVRERFGVDNVAKLESSKQRSTQTSLERYGVPRPQQNESVKEKQRRTLRERYGDSLPGPLASHKKFLAYRLQQLKTIEMLNPEDFRGKYDEGPIYYEFKCLVCGNEFSDDFHSGDPICRKCSPISCTKQETELIDYVKSIYSGEVVTHDRRVLPGGKELDLHFPDKKLAIEYDGTYWHGYSKSTTQSFLEFKRAAVWKRERCRELGIRLITIDECDYMNRPDVFKRFISDQLLERARVGARQCEAREIDPKTSREFLEAYHVNGFRGGRVKLGLFRGDELLVVANFEERATHNECTRLCFKTGVDVVGGWAKIQKHYAKPFLHYVNLKYFEGENKTGVGWRMVLPKGKVLHRVSLQKKTGLLKYCKTYYPELSDFENCLQNGMICVVDRGNDVRWYNK
jgi:rubrerythrin